MFDNLGVSLALVQCGKLKRLAVASSERLPALPGGRLAVRVSALRMPHLSPIANFMLRFSRIE